MPELSEPTSLASLPAQRPDGAELVRSWRRADPRFWCDGALGKAVDLAVERLWQCVVLDGDGPAILHEGGTYHGLYVESTASIVVEIASRFLPAVAAESLRRIAAGQREDGLLPYKFTPDGYGYRQIQMVTPLARSVWTTARLSGDTRLIPDLYPALAAHDAWLVRHRDTRGTGAVEAFGTYDTGHDWSPRFWHIPDLLYREDATRWDPSCPSLPLIAPDITANVACQREYLALMAADLGEDPQPWRELAALSRKALADQCWDATDRCWYDRRPDGSAVRIASDVLLRVLACGMGDDEVFDAACRDYLLNTRRFFPKYPFTTIAMDDPRFDPHVEQNTWAGAPNALAVVRAPAAFEAHGRHVELTWAMWPWIAAMTRSQRFPQTIDPWTGAAGFTDDYAPAIVAMLDFVDRCCGILPRPDGEVWLTGLEPAVIGHDMLGTATAAERTVGGVRYRIDTDDSGVRVHRDGERFADFPRGLRLILDGAGTPSALVGMVPQTLTGTLRIGRRSWEVAVSGNQRWRLGGDTPVLVADRGVIVPV